MVFDGKGNEITETKPKKKRKTQPKKNQSSLITRAMEADKKITRESEEIAEPQENIMEAEDIMEKVARPKTKPVASYERL